MSSTEAVETPSPVGNTSKTYNLVKKMRNGKTFVIYGKNHSPHAKRQSTEVATTDLAPRIRLRSSITPGTILIILAGYYRGSRVIFLKQLESDLLLVTGPSTINDVPLHRLCQRYVIATSTRIDISSITIPDELNDHFFRPIEKKVTGSRHQNFATKNFSPAKPDLQPHQDTLDSSLMPIIQSVPLLAEYLKARFSICRACSPHKLKF